MKSENMVKDFEEFFRDAPSLSCAIVHPFLVIIFGERERWHTLPIRLKV